MVPLVFNYQVGNPNATYPPSLTVKSSDAGVSVLSLAPTHKYVAFGLTSTPPLPPGPGYLLWAPTSENIVYFTGPYGYTTATYAEFQAISPSAVYGIAFVPGEVPFGYITSISNFAPYTNLYYLYVQGTYVTTIDFEDVFIEDNFYCTNNYSLTSIINLPYKGEGSYSFNLYDNNFPKSAIDNILIELDNKGTSFGIINFGDNDAGNNDVYTSGGAGESAYFNLVGKGWSIFTAPALSPLETNNLNNTIKYRYGGNLYINSVYGMNVAVNGDYEGVTQITSDNSPTFTYYNNLNSYVNVTILEIIGNNNVTSINVGFMSSLNQLSVWSCSNLTQVVLNSYYKNLTYVDFYNNALDQSTVNTTLTTLDTSGNVGGTAVLYGGTNASPSGDGITAKNNLLTKGWSVYIN